MVYTLRRTIVGLPFFAIGLFLLIALVSYNPEDPSFNKASSNKVTNIAGSYGAAISDPMVDLIGISSYTIPIFFIAISLNLLLNRKIKFLSLKIIFLLIVIPLLSASIASFFESMPQRKEVGGYMGAFIASEVDMRLPFAYWGVVGVCTSFFIALFITGMSFINIANSLAFIRDVILKLSQAASIARANMPEIRTLPRMKVQKREDDGHNVEIVSHNKRLEPKARLQAKIKFDENEYEFPSMELLKQPTEVKRQQASDTSLAQNAKLLNQVLEDFGIKGEMLKIHPGPVVTLYEFEPAAGVKSSRVIGLSDDIARSMSAVSARISVVPGKSSLGVELPNSHRELVLLRELIASSKYQESTDSLPIILGKNIGGEPIIADLAKMPHLLVAGTTGSGKSVAINTMILSLLYKHSPKTCKFIMIDPKMLELSVYDSIPHLLAPVVTEPSKAIAALKWVVKEMENRYRTMSTAGVRNIDGYNQEVLQALKRGEKFEKQVQIGFDQATGKPKYETVTFDSEPLPFIVVIVDEMADLMIVAGKEIESSIQRLAQMARAAGIHIIMATQRPSVDVITGVIKANFPTRISFQVTSKIDSRTILGEQGAEQLLGMGDMLYMRGGGRIERVHGPFVSDREVESITNFIKAQGAPNYIETVTKVDEESFGDNLGESGDDLYDQALRIVIRDKKASTSYIQRCLRIGYNRAANIIERMEREGVVTAPNHVGKRDVILTGNGDD